MFEQILKGTDDQSWWKLVEDWRPLRDPQTSLEEAAALRRLLDRLEQLKADVRITVNTVGPFRRWVLVVARYSFQTGRLLVARQHEPMNSPRGEAPTH
jgi:hypothetical protein